MTNTTDGKVLNDEQRQLVSSHYDMIMKLVNKFYASYESKINNKKLGLDDIEQIGLECACKIALKSDNIDSKFSTYLYSSLHLDIKRVVENYNIISIPRRDNWNGDAHKGNHDTLHLLSNGLIVELDKPTVHNNNEEEDLTMMNRLDNDSFSSFTNIDEMNMSMLEDLFASVVGEELARILILNSEGILVETMASKLGIKKSVLNNRIQRAKAKIRESVDKELIS